MRQSYTLKELEIALCLMQPRQKLYELVKNEVKRRGHWRGKPRGRLFNKEYNPYRERQRQAAKARMSKMSPEEWSAMSRKGALARSDKRSWDKLMHKEIPIAPGYVIFEDGRVWTNRRRKFLSPSTDGAGYMGVILVTAKGPCRFMVHRLVAQAFLPNPLNCGEVNHKDLNKLNNHVNNLEWCTRLDNINHSLRERGHREADIVREQADAQDRFNELINSGVPIEAALYSLC